MHKAAQLSAKLEKLSVEEGMKVIESQAEKALAIDIIDEVMCIMHSDGSANIISYKGQGAVTVEVIAAGNILKVLHHYRPFKDVFRDQVN